MFQFVMSDWFLVLAFGLFWVRTFVVLLVISAHSFFLSPKSRIDPDKVLFQSLDRLRIDSYL